MRTRLRIHPTEHGRLPQVFSGPQILKGKGGQLRVVDTFGSPIQHWTPDTFPKLVKECRKVRLALRRR